MEEIVRNTLLDVYSKLGDMEDAWHCFEEMGKLCKAWKGGKGELSLVLYVQFLRTGLRISQFTFAGVLSACAGISGLVEGKQIHALVFKTGFEGHVFVANAVMDMYANQGSLKVLGECLWACIIGITFHGMA
ncbi:hypothetical protein AMTR_s00439p00011030 [Amborella trichopoda]|uniref:Pentatricopeptide repeat-containing protein n=1 Tax=Amborella trichopoda TaxID=13333 RepID=U5D1P3_AMBTC|nr:hypothetical protein AMTR_s00439p00011030 [Amborella trichopoda]